MYNRTSYVFSNAENLSLSSPMEKYRNSGAYFKFLNKASKRSYVLIHIFWWGKKKKKDKTERAKKVHTADSKTKLKLNRNSYSQYCDVPMLKG